MIRPRATALSRAGILPWDLAALGALLVLVALVLGTHRDYGVAWDEPIHWDYGDAVLRFYASLGGDTAAREHADGRYGPGFDLAGAAVRRISPLDDLATMRLFGGMVGLLGMVGAWRLGRLLGGPRAGFLVLVLLATTPAYYGRMFFNPKDMPFAVGYVWAVYYLVRLARSLPRPPASLLLKLAVAMGLAASVRIAGLVTILYAVLLGGMGAVQVMLRPGPKGANGKGAGILMLRVLAAAAGAWAVLVLLWPWAQPDPVRRPLQALSVFSHYADVTTWTRLAGTNVPVTDLPWTYLPRYFLVQIPEVILALAAGGALFVLIRTVGALRFRRPLPLAEGLLVIAVVLPVAVVFVRGTPVYDGVRQFVFIVPVLCVGAGLAASSVPGWARRRVPALALAGILVVSQASVVRDVVRLHPYEYAYFNHLSGGFSGSVGSYDTDYYGLSFKELCGRLADHLWASDPRFLNHDYRIISCVPPFFYEMQSPANFTYAGFRRPELFLGYRCHGCLGQLDEAPLMTSVGRLGHVLAVARDLRGGSLERR